MHADDARLRRIAVLDAVINNADRKGGHLLPGSDGRLYGIDHGVTFHVEDKLRTLLWGWAGRAADRGGRRRLTGRGATWTAALAERLARCSPRAEIDALRARVDRLLLTGCTRRPARRLAVHPAGRRV